MWRPPVVGAPTRNRKIEFDLDTEVGQARIGIMNLPSELKEAVAHGLPVELTDGPNRYLVIRAEMYERLLGVLDLSEHTSEEKQFLLQQWGEASGWEEPSDSVFDSLEPK